MRPRLSENKGWKCSSLVESVPIMHIQIPGSVLGTENSGVKKGESGVGVSWVQGSLESQALPEDWDDSRKHRERTLSRNSI